MASGGPAGVVQLSRPAQPWGLESQRVALIDAIEGAVLVLLSPARASNAKAGLSSQALRLRPENSSQALRLAAKLRPLFRLRGNRGRRLQRWLALLDDIHALLVEGRHATSRELYYSHVGLFSRQNQSDYILKNLCGVLGVPRHQLRLVGTARGLVRGHLRILEPCFSRAVAGSVQEGGTSTGCWVDGMEPLEPGGHAISPICARLVRLESNAKVVIVIEKETVFHRLLSEGVLDRHRPCVLVTARGFPDVPTRQFLARAFEDLGGPRVLALTDFDASGLAIGMTYAFGPQKAWMQDDLALPTTLPLLLPGGAAAAGPFGLLAADTLPLTSRDRSLGQGLLQRLAAMRQADAEASGVAERTLAAWEEAVSALLAGGVKYELDALSGLSDLVDSFLRADETSRCSARAAGEQ